MASSDTEHFIGLLHVSKFTENDYTNIAIYPHVSIHSQNLFVDDTSVIIYHPESNLFTKLC